MMNPVGAGSDNKPVLVVVMGVSGAGKSTVAEALAGHCGYRYLDADDYHSAEARAHMASGQPLTDAMRIPWVEAICRHLCELAAQGVSATLAFSGLRKVHREPLRHCGFDTLFLFLDGDRETISQRMAARTNHFMPTSLLDSQFASLERPDNEADVHALNIEPSLTKLLQDAIDVIEDRRSN